MDRVSESEVVATQKAQNRLSGSANGSGRISDASDLRQYTGEQMKQSFWLRPPGGTRFPRLVRLVVSDTKVAHDQGRNLISGSLTGPSSMMARKWVKSEEKSDFSRILMVS